ncbi:MAG TPA: lipase family protein, partial [Steroidobacteraceae bacterium]|nr:lipase family protein [Steroidobacteraceae bacterium]
DDEDSPETSTATSPPRGTLDGAPELVRTMPAAALLLQIAASTDPRLLAPSDLPLCDIAIYRIRYKTVGAVNESTTASTALMIPTGVASECRGDRPVLLYAHGTVTERAYTMTNLDNTEALIMAAVFASQGYIVVAPNYAGYDTSTLPYHPYLVADQQSKDMIDGLRASRTALPLASLTLTRDSGKLFITGYSQGGYVAMATHRAMQAAGMPVTASAPMSGPYALNAFVDALFAGRVNSGAPLYSTMLITAYQRAYGNLYASPADAFESEYATGIESLIPSAISRGDLYAQGKLPRTALFDSTPPAPEYADITPATTPANLAPIFASGFGTDGLLKNSFRLAYLQDASAQPDGGWPTTTNGLASASPTFGMRRGLKENDLRNWTPTAPTFLCGGNADPSVYWFNTQLMQSYWATNAATSVTVLDIDSPEVANDPYGEWKQQFVAAKLLVAANAIANGATDGGAAAVADAYHDQLVPAFCLLSVRSYFEGLQ